MDIRTTTINSARRALLVALGAATLASCARQQQGGPQQSVPEYAVSPVAYSSITLNNNYPATIRGRQDVEIRPNVSGFITRLCVDEGATVSKGQTLFLIDPVQFEEAVNVARAAVEVAETNVATAQLTADNKRRLAAKEIISQYELQMAENTLATQKAALAQAKAQLVNAEKNLSYTRVTSPSNGIVGTIPFRVGSLVSPSSATPLTIVSDISEMYVYFSMNEKDLLQLIRQGGTREMIEQMPQVELQLADGTVYPQKGRIETLSGVIDPITGSATVRAAFPNPGRILRSGGSGVVMVPVTRDSSLLIPQKATYEIQDKKFVYALSDSSTVRAREISILPVDDGKNYVVTAGLEPGQRIVVEGVGTSVRDGMKIKPISPEQAAAKLSGAARANAGAGK